MQTSLCSCSCLQHTSQADQVHHHCCFHGKERPPVLAHCAVQQQDDYDHRCHECRGIAVEEHLIPHRMGIMDDRVTCEMAITIIRPKGTWRKEPSLVCDGHRESSNQHQIFTPFAQFFSQL